MCNQTVFSFTTTREREDRRGDQARAARTTGMFGCCLPGSSDARQRPQALDFDRLGLRSLAWQASPGQGGNQTCPKSWNLTSEYQ